MFNLITVAQAMNRYQLTKHVIYEAIKHDPTFPAINLGPKKNYRIDENDLVLWLKRKRHAPTDAPLHVPTGDDLLKELDL